MNLDDISNKEETKQSIIRLATEVTDALTKYESLLKTHLNREYPDSFICPYCNKRIETVEVDFEPFTFEDWEDVLEDGDPIKQLSGKVMNGINKILHNIRYKHIPMNTQTLKYLENLLEFAKIVNRIQNSTKRKILKDDTEKTDKKVILCI